MVRIGIGGLGRAGFPLALSFDDEGFDVVGYDIDRDKLDELRSGIDPFGEFGAQNVQAADITYRSDAASLAACDYIIVCVPTPITEDDVPDLSMVRGIGRDIGRHITTGTTVVLESTIYPGGTREALCPAIAETSGLTPEEDFRVGYSPERVVPGRDPDDLPTTVKVIGAQDRRTTEDLASLYGTVFEEVHRAPTIETAEAAKCLENTQRDVNIALINEFAMATDDIDRLDYEAVLEAAGTKWNFHRYEPGLVGGHCIPVDPYYLIDRLERGSRSTELMRTARAVNRRLVDHVVELVFDAIGERRRMLQSSERRSVGEEVMTTDGGYESESVLLAGLTYKPNSGDVRSRPIRRVVERLRTAGLDVAGFDPNADREALFEQYDLPIQTDLSVSGFTGMVVLTPHDAFSGLDIDALSERMADRPFFVDLKGVLSGDERSGSDYIYERL